MTLIRSYNITSAAHTSPDSSRRETSEIIFYKLVGQIGDVVVRLFYIISGTALIITLGKHEINRLWIKYIYGSSYFQS